MRQPGWLLLLLLAAGCATEEKRGTPVVPEASPTPSLDYQAIRHDLGIDASPTFTGYQEKTFDACRYAADLPEVRDCSHAYFIQVGVRLSCRPTEEAQNNFLEQSELTPVGNRELRWNIGQAAGRIRTDSAGYGLILAITPGSMKTKRLRISTGVDFLLMPVHEATEIVTPNSWCR